MKIAVHDYQVKLSIRSTVCGRANDAELYVKKLLFTSEAVKVDDVVVRVADIDPIKEAQRLSRFMDKELFEKTFGALPEDWERFMQRFEYKSVAKKQTSAK